jgi:hypothetical protein
MGRRYFRGQGVKEISIRRAEGDEEGRGRVFRQDGGSFLALLRRDSATDARAPFSRSLSHSARLEIPGRDRHRGLVERAGKGPIQYLVLICGFAWADSSVKT